ncbi:Fatty acid oxidation complex subunit alpha [Symmachiella macrocystis]|uniref:enoyl-CoA hydratase n=1 Tax=Symmachiella macrocystis TaxID=2527985 RepID=A0A5C6BRZ7_9PLAN|nr:3-hydroxyacyl-CoA dehydrogenase NAD-binding domain-containing protein [Symmachiella macrocystis]TWU14482.1 Fatty acid oxidation complex subunit alpha [Symmachiella macrocystis]
MANVFELTELDGKIALLTFDAPGKKVNTFGQPVLAELTEIVTQLEAREDLQGLLLKSGKPGQFIAGADLTELGALMHATPEQLGESMKVGHALFSRISKLPFPTVALIDGNCMGGGTEITLSMDYRIAADTPKTKIGLPEVNVGIIPGWGGTQRLPRLIGLNPALDMICSGNPITGKKAAELGFAFDAVPPEHLIDEGRRLIAYARESDDWRKRRTELALPLGLSEDQLHFSQATAEGYIMGKTKGQYPAPIVAIRAIMKGANLPLDEALKVEQEASLEVVGSEISTNLIAIFFMNTRLARDPGVADTSIVPRDVNRVAVFGSGLMGAGIATSHARVGIRSLMLDVDDDRIADGMKRARKVVEGRIKIGRATYDDLANMLSCLDTSTDKSHVDDCDVVVEAITEREEVKTALYKELAGLMRDDAILASNTSTISITRMGKSAPHPERFVGMHFFFPVDRMQLVEVIRGDDTSDETIATIVALSKRIKKTPIVVGDCPGFLVNRVLLPYMNEALQLLLEGASMDAIDKAALRFGMPMGPIALQDVVGLDTSYYAGMTMVNAYSDRAILTPLLKDLVEAGRMGKKSGSGFRKYTGKKGKPEPDAEFTPFLEKNRVDNREISQEEITQRLFLPMFLESTRVLEENIVREPGDVDMGLILGIGFPAFRGGILRWADSVGADQILKDLEPYTQLGKRFEPTDMLKQLASSGKKIYE